MRDLLPTRVFDEIRDHLVNSVAQGAAAAWQSAMGDEDSITGDICGQLRKGPQTVTVDGVTWQWRVDYRKFRGRGPAAPEKAIGADGVFTVEIEGGTRAASGTKTLLFQAKKAGSTSGLREQVRKMEGVVPQGSAVFEYAAGGFTATRGDSFLSGRESEEVGKRVSLGSFLGDQFLGCSVGQRGLAYDDQGRRLVFADGRELRFERGPVEHRVRIRAVRG